MSDILFAGGTVLDGTGATPTVADVRVRDGRVDEVGPDLGVEAEEVIDCSGMTVLPGLFDAHVHVLFEQINLLRMLQAPFSYPYYQAIAHLSSTLDTGVTWVRDAGGADLGVAQAVRDGLIRGPQIQVALTMLFQTGGHGDGVQACGVDVPLFGVHPGRG